MKDSKAKKQLPKVTITAELDEPKESLSIQIKTEEVYSVVMALSLLASIKAAIDEKAKDMYIKHGKEGDTETFVDFWRAVNESKN